MMPTRTAVPAWITLLLVVLTLSLGSVAAQVTLRVDGRDAGPVRSDLLSGTSYASLDRLANALNLETVLDVGGSALALSLGGQVVTIELVSQGVSPAREGAVRLNGAPAGNAAAVRTADGVWLPIAPIVRAFSGSVGFLPEENTVVVVTPRARLADSAFTITGTSESLVLTLDAPVTVQRSDDPLTGAVELFLPRAAMDRAYTESGALLPRVGIFPSDGGIRVRVEAPGVEIEVLELARGAGTDVVVRARRAPGSFVPRDAVGEPTIALEAGFVTEAPAARGALLSLTQAMASELAALDVDTVLVRTGDAAASDAQRLQNAVTSDLYLLIHVGDLAFGEVRLWTLGEASSANLVDDAIRRNAADGLGDALATTTLRRELLLGLVPDVAMGQRAAETLAAALFQEGGYRAGAVLEAPLAVLAPAAGRGILIEVAEEDLTSPDLPAALARALASRVLGAP